jgi:NADH:ubiquinone oxidoreductase subunit C
MKLDLTIKYKLLSSVLFNTLQYCVWIFAYTVNSIYYLTDFTIKVISNRRKIIPIVALLRDHSVFLVDQLIDITAVDYIGRPKRFYLYYLLLSRRYNSRFMLETQIRE